MVGMVAVLASMFKPTWAQYTAPIYALCKGVALAGMSAVLEMQYPGEWGSDYGIQHTVVLLAIAAAQSHCTISCCHI